VNPFFPPKESEQSTTTITTNTPQRHEPLRQATISLPSSARILKEISVEYINLDGSTERKSIAVDNTIDWHLPLVISQANVNNTVMNSTAVSEKEIKVDSKDKELVNFKFISFSSKGKTIRINTKDKYLRNFLIVNPYRIVVDFKSDKNFNSFTKMLPNSIVKSIRVGNHDDFYRVVLELDGQYRYTFSQDANGCVLLLN
jgi:hypothetical protein